MKKRKPPIVAVTALILLVGVVYIVSSPKAKDEPNNPTVSGTANPTGTADDAAKSMKESVNTKAPNSGKMMTSKDTGSPIDIHVYPSVKPKKNDSDPQSQWYANDKK